MVAVRVSSCFSNLSFLLCFQIFPSFLFSKPPCPSCFCFFPSVSASLSFSKILPPGSFLSFSKKSSPLWFRSLPCIYRQPGERFTIPCPSAGHGGVGVAGYGCVGVGMGHAGFLGKWGGEREKGRITGKISKILFSPVSAFVGEKKLHSAVQNGTVQFFF